MTTYLLDANVFIQAKNLHYGFDFCPAFWEWLDEQNNAAKVFSIERVQDEVLAIDDELAAWARQRPGLFLPPDETMVPSLGALSALRAELEDRGMRAVRLGQSRTQRLRHCLLHTAARITHTGRQHIAKLADDWPWTRHLITAFQHVHNLPLLT